MDTRYYVSILRNQENSPDGGTSGEQMESRAVTLFPRHLINHQMKGYSIMNAVQVLNFQQSSVRTSAQDIDAIAE